MFQIFHTKFDERLSELLFNLHLENLSPTLQLANLAYKRWQDRHLHLFSKLLLIEGLKQFGLGKEELNNLEYNKNGRPFFKKSNIDFNISHSGNRAVCVISDKSKVGVDIEEIKPIDFSVFKKEFIDREWSEIENSQDTLSKFYSFWTRKESIIKADGRGLTIPLNRINILDNRVIYDKQKWYLKELEIHNEYRACLASNIPCLELNILEIDFLK